MPIYQYKAITANGRMNTGQIEADSEAFAKLSLRRNGEQVVRIKEFSDRRQPARHTVSGGRKAPTDEVASTIRQLSIMTRAGVPLVEALRGLAEQSRSKALAECLRDIASNVSQGMALSAAFARNPSIFPTLAVEMARIAEAGGNLAEAMAKLADHMESGAEISRRVRSAMAYPIVIAVISVITVVVMSTFILPRFVGLFHQMGIKLPWTTKVLMYVSHAMTSDWYLFLAVTLGAVYAIRRYAGTRSGRRNIDRLALGLPLLGDIVRKIVLGRVVASMSTLLAGGVPMVSTLEISAAAANNQIVREALLRARTDVAEGSAVSQSLRASGVFPPLVLQMVASGEKTGDLPEMLNHVCIMYERETDAKIKSLTSVIEPIMIVLLAGVVGFIAVSVILPIYSLVGGVK